MIPAEPAVCPPSTATSIYTLMNIDTDHPILAFFDFLVFFWFSGFPCFFCVRFPSFCKDLGVGDRDRGGVKSPKIRGGVKIFNFQGHLKLTPFYRDSIEIANLGAKSPSLRGATFGASSPPPLAFGTFSPPLSRFPKGFREREKPLLFGEKPWFRCWVHRGCSPKATSKNTRLVAQTLWLLSYLFLAHQNYCPSQSAEVCRRILLYKYWRIFSGIFLEDFSGHFSHKNEEKKSGEKIREKIRRPKNKNPRKIRSAKIRP